MWIDKFPDGCFSSLGKEQSKDTLKNGGMDLEAQGASARNMELFHYLLILIFPLPLVRRNRNRSLH